VSEGPGRKVVITVSEGPGRKVVITVSEGPLTPIFWAECVKSIRFLQQTLTPIYHATCFEPGTYQNESG
jgi:hypothetical protein